MTRRVLIIVALVIAIAIAIPAVAVYYAAYTESGLQLIVRHIPKRIGRTQLEIVGARGTLAGGFTLERLETEHERVHLRFEGVEGHFRLAPLLWQTLHASDVHMRNVYVEVRRRKRPATRNTPRFLPPGLIIRVDRARADAGTLIATNGRRFDVTDVSTSGVARYRTLRFFEAGFVQNAMQVTGNATLHAADPMEIDGDARVLLRWEGQPQWVITASGRGDLDQLDLTAQFTAPLQAEFTGKAKDLTRGWHWSGNAKLQSLDLRTWGGGGALGRIWGELALRGDASGFAARGPLTPEGLKAGAFQTVFEGSYSQRVLKADRIELTHGSGAHAEGSGTLSIVPDGPQLDLHGTWSNFRWPLVGDAVAVQSAHGEFVLSGVRPFNVRAIGTVAPGPLPPMQVEMEGQLATDRFLVSTAHVQAFDGEADVSGEVGWSPEQRWTLTGDVSGMNPESLRSDLPGKLDFSFTAGGSRFGSDGDFAVSVRDLRGRLRGTTASGGGQIARTAGAWEFSQLRLTLGGTKLAADGRVADTMDLRFAIDADDLSVLANDSRGNLRAQGTLRGTARNPIIDADLRGSGIQHAGVAIESIMADVRFDASGAQPSDVDIRAQNIVVGKRTVNEVAIGLNGAAADHVAHITARAPDLALDSELSGVFAHGVWIGQMRKLTVNGSESLHLELDSPVDVLLSDARMRIDWFCLNGAPARVCADADWSPARWSATVNANGLPLRTLMSGLSPTVNYRGRLTVMARAFGGPAEPVQGTVRADLVDAAIAHRLASGRVERITLGTGLVTLDASPSAINATVSLDAGEVGTVRSRLNAQRTSARWQDMPVTGEVHAETAELGFIALYLPDIDRLAGRLVSDLAVSGTMGRPLIDGKLELSDAEMDLYQVNLALRGARLEAQLQQNGLDFTGSARMGDGTVSAGGHLEWRDAKPYGKFRLQGENLRVMDVPEAQIDASPALDFTIEGRRIEVTGAVQVPYARIAPADLTNAVRASSDEIVAGQEEPDPSKRFEVSTGISLTLGDKVSIDTLGLTARLTGSITLRSGGNDDMTRGAGELSVQDGKYTAYGRRLDIERGRLVFSGGPVNNPGVDIRAVKEYPDVKAGVNVRGTLLQPRLSFFSEPSLPQSQIVSLILAGGSLESAQNRSNPNQAGNEALAQGSAILAQQLGARVGIEDVSLESNLANETSLVLGKYLSPRLYVSYGISFTEQINTLKLRYSLSDRWTVKTEVGQARGADLVYTIEK
ncbi:MAG: translocation/assembly module TamB domain-containing protein [Steroidobacteraceae bacterium]|nr:translocation/assembly module TamB domain-containing protein [Steroidobacteraceae bacterium]